MYGITTRRVAACTLLLVALSAPSCSDSGKSGDPALSVTPLDLDFGAETESLDLRIENTGGGKLDWELFSFPTWVSFEPASGTNDSTVTVSVNRDEPSMNTGMNTATLSVTAFVDGSRYDSKDVTITAEKLAPGDPVLSVDTESLDFGPHRDELLLGISNSGGGMLSWQASADQPWLSISPSSAESNYTSVTVAADRSLLDPGGHSATITITSNGGDKSIAVTLVAYDPNSNYKLQDYFPLAVGNSWQWQQPGMPYTYKITITDQFQKNGLDVWAAHLEDAWTESRDFYLVYSNGVLNVVSDDDANLLDQLPDLQLNTGAPSCGDFANYASFEWLNEDLTPREDYDPCWDSPVTYVPGSLFELIDTYGITGSTMTSADFPLADLPDCIGKLERDNSDHQRLYQVLCKGRGLVLWDYWPLFYENVGGDTLGREALPYQGGVSPVDRPGSNLLFYTYDDVNWTFSFVFGVRSGDTMRPTHVIQTSWDGYVSGTVFVNQDFIPVEWIMEGQTITVHNLGPPGQENQPGVFDPAQAYLIAFDSDQRTEGRLDIYPEPLAQVVDDYEYFSGADMSHVRQLLASQGISTWQQLVTLAKQPGPEQARWQSLALGIGLATTETRLSSSTTLRFLPLDIAVDIGLGLLNDKLGNALCPHCPDQYEPTMELAICQGLYIAAGPVQICHYCFFWTNPISPCINFCQVSTGCFTNICMPTEVSAEWVRQELENNQTGYGW
ncbi:MAG: hypothetical protein D6806_18220 [Deltaproteobacteria bacterium]|nr:MAG: hypothetical protein D6806_18220 [Deltaproteobacteria bacterium]